MAEHSRISCSSGPEHCSRISSSSSSINIRSIVIRWLTAISLKLIMTLLSDVTTHGFPVTLTSMTSNDSSSVRLRCEFGIDLANVTEVTLGRNKTETGRWEILFVYWVDNATNQFMNSWEGRASASVGVSHTMDITIGNATPWDCGLFGCQVTNRLNEQQRNFTRIGCAAFEIVNITSTTLSPSVPASSDHLPIWATVLIVLAVVVVVVLVVSGLIVAAFKFKGNGNQVSPDYDSDLSAERNHHLRTGAADDKSATKGESADNRKKQSTKRRRGDGEQKSLGYSSSRTSNEENNVDRFAFQQQQQKKKKYRQTPDEHSPTSSVSSTKASHAEDAGFKRHKRRQSRTKTFDDEEIAEEEEREEEKPSTSQNSDVEASARRTQQRGNALPPLRPKKKKKKRKVEEPMAVMYKD